MVLPESVYSRGKESSERCGDICAQWEQATTAGLIACGECLDRVNLALVVIDAEGTVAIANRAAAGLLGCESAELIGRDWLNLVVSPEYRDRQRSMGNHSSPQTPELSGSIDAKLPGIGGRDVHSSWHNSVLRNSHGEAIGIVATSAAATSNRAADHRNQNAERLFQELFQSVQEGIAVIDAGDVLLYGNPALADLLDYDSQVALVGQSVWQFITPEELPAVEVPADILRGGKPVRLEVRIRTAKQRDKHVLVAMSPRFDDNGSYNGAVASVLDLTDRKRMEDELERQKLLLGNILSNVPQHIFWKDTDLRYVGCNRYFAEVAGMKTPDEIVGKKDTDLPWSARETESYNKCDREVIEKGISMINIEESQRRFDGGETTVLTSKVPLLDSRGKVIGVLGQYSDITELKNLEKALRRSEEKFRNLFEKSNDAILLLDETGIIECNRAGLNLFGFQSESEMTGRKVAELSGETQPDGSRTEAFLAAKYAEATSRGAARFEWLARRSDGTEFPTEVLLNAVSSGGREILQAVVRDISERKQMEDRLHRKSRDLSSRVKELNCLNEIAILRDDFGLSDDKFLRRAVELIPRTMRYPDIAVSAIRIGDRVYQTDTYDRTPWTAEMEIESSEKLHGSISVSYLEEVPDADEGKFLVEEIELISRIGRDIGVFLERRQAQLTLQRTVAQYTAMINTVPAIVYLKNASNRYIAVNEAFCRAVNRAPQDILGTTEQALFASPPAEELREIDRRVLIENQRVVDHEERVKDFGGEIRWISATRIPVLDDHEAVTGVVGLIQDVTEHHVSREKLIQADKLAAIGTLAAGVAHEINNPIGFISSNLNTMGKYLTRIRDFFTKAAFPESPELAKMNAILEDFGDAIEESNEGAVRVRRIVSDLKNFSRVDKTEKEYVNIRDGLESTLNIVWNELKYKCTIEKEYGEVPDIYCMPHQINQVFMNLLINAGQAIEDSHGTITIKTWCDTVNAHVSIKDTGRGIEPHLMSKIFEPFFTTKEVGQGTGLGLSLAYDIVNKHGGSIEVSSRVGVGTEFLVHLPMKGIGNE